MKNTLAILVALSLTGASALAEETTPATEANTSTVKVSEVQKPEEAKKDIDDEITNARLRATTGSKKKWSFAGGFGYSGASIKNPTSTERPQLNDGQASADPVSASADLSIKYRMTENDALNFGFGMSYTPEYTKNKITGEKAKANLGASNPYVSYTRAFKAADVQHVLSASLSKYTLPEDVDDKKLAYSTSVSHTMMAPIGNSKAELGLYTFIGGELYSEANPSSTDGRTAYQFGLNPIFEYAFSDTVSFRTVSRWLTWTVLDNDYERGYLAGITQSMGVGFAVSRDIYLYPNMQWKWSQVNADQTTVGFSANINL